MLFFLNKDKQVAIDTAVACRITLSANGKLHSIGNTRRDMKRNDGFVANNTFAITFRTLLDDNFAFATASRTCRLRLHLSENRVGYTSYNTRSTTRVAGLCPTIAIRSRPVAMATRHIFLYLNLLIYTSSNILQRHLHLDTQIRTTVHAAASTRTSEATKPPEASEMPTEDIAELREYIIHRHSPEATACGRSSTYASMSELVVALAFLRVAQDIVCLGSFLEFLFSLFVSRVLVRMVLDCFFPVCFLYLVS